MFGFIWEFIKYTFLSILAGVVFLVVWVLFLFPFYIFIYPLIKAFRWIFYKEKLFNGPTSIDYDGYGSP